MRQRIWKTPPVWLKLTTTAILLVGQSGCGRSGSDALPSVEGQVRYANKPLTKGTVIFYPDTAKGNHSKEEPHGGIDTEGRFRMYTHPRAGAAPGWYKVAVIATEPRDSKNPYSEPRSLIPEKYGKSEESRLTLEVRPDAPTGAYDLTLK